MMEGLWQFFVLVYYSLATWAFCLLVADNDSIIDGAIDSDKEFVWVMSIIGLGCTMLDVVVTLGRAAESFFLREQVEWHPTNGYFDAYIRELGTAGVYLATFLYATRSRRIEELERESGTFATDIPFLLAATTAVLGGVLSDLPQIDASQQVYEVYDKTKKTYYTSLRPPAITERAKTDGLYM